MGNKKGAIRGPYLKAMNRKANSANRVFDAEASRAAKKQYPLFRPAISDEEYEKYQQAKKDVFWGKKMTDKRLERIERFKAAMAKEKLAADELCWEIDGFKYNRYEVIKMILGMVAEGYTLAEVCRFPGYPPLWMVRDWERMNAGFKNDLKFAEQTMAELRYQESIDIVMEAEDHNNAKLVQLKSEAQAKLAAMTDSKWNAKQQIQVEDTTAPKDIDDVKKRLENWAKANPEVAAKMMPELHAKMQEELKQQTIGYVDATVENTND